MTRALAVLLLLAAAAGVRAQQFMPTGKETLRGLPGLEVLIEQVDPSLSQKGLTVAALAGDVADQLRAGGITIYPSQMQNPSPSKAYLYVQVTGFPLQQQGDVLTVQVQVRQMLRSLVTNSDIVNAMTWDQGTTLFAPERSTQQVVQQELQSLVDRFVRDWRAVH